MYVLNQGCMSPSTYLLQYGRHVVFRRAIHAASHVDHKKAGLHGFPYDSVPINMGLCLAALRATGALLYNDFKLVICW